MNQGCHYVWNVHNTCIHTKDKDSYTYKRERQKFEQRSLGDALQEILAYANENKINHKKSDKTVVNVGASALQQLIQYCIKKN